MRTRFIQFAGAGALFFGIFFGARLISNISIPYLYLLSASSITATETIPVAETEPKAQETPVTHLTFIGDIMLDRGVRRSVEKNFEGNYDRLFENVSSLKNADILFANLEGDVSDKGHNVGSKFSFRMDPIILPTLKNAGIDIVSFANNHVGDWSKEAFDDTRTRLDASGIKYSGAGDTKTDAREPEIFEVNGKKIGYLGFTDVGPNWLEATDTSSGVNLASDPDFANIISSAKQKVDVLIVSMHWGIEYKPHNARQEILAHTAIDAGAQMVIGHHPHIMQDLEKYHGGLIAYSLGNFIFDQYFSNDTMRGMVLGVDLTDGAITNVSVQEVHLNRQYQPTGLYPFTAELQIPTFNGHSSTPSRDTLTKNPEVIQTLPTTTLSFVGDIVPGAQAQDSLFENIASTLQKSDILVGNLEGVLYEDPPKENSKCGLATKHCYAFSGNNSFAPLLVTAGFDVLNVANNHANDFGETGKSTTLENLSQNSLVATGVKDTVSYLKKNNITFGFVGFSTYHWTSLMDNAVTLKKMIAEAHANADVVVVIFHGGAEGTAYMHTPTDREYYLGENRGDVRAFAHTAIDAGANAVFGSGPHVLRGMEWYKGKPIAYSLGNFASAGNLSTKDFLKNSGIVTFTFSKSGDVIGGSFLPIVINSKGMPTIDTENTGLHLTTLLSKQDFPASALLFDEKGILMQ